MKREKGAYYSRPSRAGRIERTSKSRTFVPAKRPALEDCKVTYTDDGVRTVTPPDRNPRKTVYWNGKPYRIPANIAG